MHAPTQLLPPLAVEKPGSSTESKLDLLLSRVEESHCLQLEMFGMLQKIGIEIGSHSHESSNPRTARRVTERSAQRSEPRHSFLSSEMTNSRPPSMKKMEDALFRELGGLLESSAALGPLARSSGACRSSGVGRSTVLSAADHGGMNFHEDENEICLPGRLPAEAKASLAVSATRLQSMNRQSQAFILSKMAKIDESRTKSSPRSLQLDRTDRLMGSNLLLSRPWLLRSLVAFACFSQIATIIALKIVGKGQLQGHGFTLLSSLLYAAAAGGSLQLLGRANRSPDLELAITRLHSFVADFTLRWNDVSGKEWRKFLAGWLVLVVVFSATQGFEAWLLSRDLMAEDSLTQALSYAVAALSALSLCVSGGVVTLTGYMQSHVMIGLHKSLDCWCCDIANNQDFEAGVQNWNGMQALLKCVARELANSFLLLHTLAVVGFACFLTGCATIAAKLITHGKLQDRLRVLWRLGCLSLF
ncbi:unnamed protein product [Symbiodinium natans]|uniref:Uncharacterized protein n=1 Tax=Symbiodinium natans TaxID=878477 RepID=A0A812UGH9_9DINO|nr:unnamed protein product [Symbiodinium natans]